MATGSPAVTFNAAGLSDDTIRDLGQSPCAARQAAGDGQIRTYDMGLDPLDPLTSTQNATAMPDALGTQLDLQYRALPNLGADAMDRFANVVGRVVENAGGVLANDLAEVGEYLGLKKPGQAAGGAVAQAADAVGQGVDRAGDAVKAVAERLSNFLNPFR